mgnify:CR=1 FL=1
MERYAEITVEFPADHGGRVVRSGEAFMWQVTNPSDEALAAWKTLQGGSKNVYLSAMVRALATEEAPELDAAVDEVNPFETVNPFCRPRRDTLDDDNPFAAAARELSTCRLCNAA